MNGDVDNESEFSSDLMPSMTGLNIGSPATPIGTLYADQVYTTSIGPTLFGTLQQLNTNCAVRVRAQGGSGVNACCSIEFGNNTYTNGTPSSGGFTIGPWGSGRSANTYMSYWDTAGSFIMHQSAWPTAVIKPNNTGGLYIPTTAPTQIELGKIWYNGTNLCVGTGTSTFKTATLS